MIIINFTEEELQNYLASHPSFIFDEEKGIVRKKTKVELEIEKNEGKFQEKPKKKKNKNTEDTLFSLNNITEEKEEKKKKKSKYKNIKVYEYENGFVSTEKDIEKYGAIATVFDSKKEFRRWNELRNMEMAGEISELQRQIPLIIQEAFKYEGKRIAAIKYQADHIYVKDGRTVVEDVKPFDNKTQKFRTTKDFNLKWKLLKFKYPEYLFELF